MINALTRIPMARAGVDLVQRGIAMAREWKSRHGKGGMALKIFMGAFFVGIGVVFVGTIGDYGDRSTPGASGEEALSTLPSVVPIVFQGLALFLALAAFVIVFWVNDETGMDRKRSLIVLSLGLASLAGLAAWLPSDVIATRAAILGNAPAGETPSIPAYIGMLLLVSMLILSVPVVALVYFRLDLMDRYVLQSFMLPFFFCLLSFMAIWILGDLSNNGNNFAGLSAGRVLSFYVVQVPFVVLFVMPIAVMLSGLYSLGKMSKSNEFISMIGAGRSVPRILAPLFIAGVYVALVGLAFKYQWAPASVGYKEAILEGAKREQWVKRQGHEVRDELWSKRGWMHVDRAERRTWFVGRVPLKLSDEMADVIVTQLDDQDQPVKMWIARRAKWVWNSDPPKWILQGVRIYTYDAQRIPTIQTMARLELMDWTETPWKVLSSSQKPEFLGIPGLTMYLRANGNLDKQSLAPFRTNWWNIFAEPMACIAMILVAAPLGIVYSRRGAMGGITAAICIFALMYVLNGTFIAMGHTGALPPFLAAWTTNFVVAGIGLILLWYRAKNRDLPTLKSLFAKPRRRVSAPTAG